eukprot:72766-Lingulodinium_polyedra.AAC.1
MFQGGSTKVVEDVFQRLRIQEQRGNSNARVAPDRAWATLITRQVISQVQHYEEVSHSSVGLKRYHEDLRQVATQRWYTPAKHRPLLPLQDVVSTRQEARALVPFCVEA